MHNPFMLSMSNLRLWDIVILPLMTVRTRKKESQQKIRAIWFHLEVEEISRQTLVIRRKGVIIRTLTCIQVPFGSFPQRPPHYPLDFSARVSHTWATLQSPDKIMR